MSPFAMPQQRALSLPEYALKARESYRFDNDPSGLQKVRFGYFGEVGGLLAFVKKSNRDYVDEVAHEAASEELGDALWYLVMTAHQLQITADDLGIQCINILRGQFGEQQKALAPPITFRQIDGLVDAHRNEATISRPVQLEKLASSAGQLAGTTDTQLKAMAPPMLCEHFGNLLAQLVLACASFDLRIEDVARHNLEKINSRWPGDGAPNGVLCFDPLTAFPEHEQLPRNLEIEFIERGTPQEGYVVQRLRGVYIGDRLTDNSNEQDDYRFHDVFHLAYMAYLGWSPVMRALLKRKRKSDPRKDENEDGARAIIIEEGIATWIFNHAKRHRLYEHVEVGKLQYGLLKQIQGMVRGYEVEQCKLWQWEHAILKGFEVFRSLKLHRGGTVTVDMDKQTIAFEPPKRITV